MRREWIEPLSRKLRTERAGAKRWNGNLEPGLVMWSSRDSLEDQPGVEQFLQQPVGEVKSRTMRARFEGIPEPARTIQWLGRRWVILPGLDHVYESEGSRLIVTGTLAGRTDGVLLSGWRAAESAAARS
jgi:hypothetical protein